MPVHGWYCEGISYHYAYSCTYNIYTFSKTGVMPLMLGQTVCFHHCDENIQFASLHQEILSG